MQPHCLSAARAGAPPERAYLYLLMLRFYLSSEGLREGLCVHTGLKATN